MWYSKYTKTSRIDVVENKIFKCAGVWDFPDPRVAGGRKGHPKSGALLSYTGIDHILEIIHSVLLGLELGRIESHCNVV